jgi:hypothetical protein
VLKPAPYRKASRMSLEDVADADHLSSEDRDLLSRILGQEGISLEEGATIRPAGRRAPLPLSFALERLWFGLAGGLDLRALARTLDELQCSP